MTSDPVEVGAESRYDRQARLPQIGPEGQRSIESSCVAVVGLGALGSVAADLLARAGVGRLILIDRDVVEWPNLQRQTLYDEEDARKVRPKVEAAVDRLEAVNSSVELIPYALDLTASQATSVLRNADLLLDGTDNFTTRYLLNDYAVSRQRPYVYAGVVGTYGLVGSILPGKACLRCTYPEPPDAADTPNCRTAGVLGPAVSVVAGLASAEALKWASGHADSMEVGYRYVDLWNGESRALRVESDPECPCCSKGEYPWLDGRRGHREAEPLCGGNAVQIPAPASAPDLESIGRRLHGVVDRLEMRPQFLRFREGDLELLLFQDGRALVRGTEDTGRARALLDRTVGE